MESKVLLGKLALGLAGIVFSLIACLLVDRCRLTWRQFSAVAWASMILTRGGLFVLLFIALDLPAQSDVSGYYYPQMKVALKGGLPYRDYFSAYAPLFAYVGAAAIWVWDSPKAIVLLTIGFEAASFTTWLGIARRFFNERTAHLATLLYIVNVLPVFNAAIDGQNQAWVACFLGLAILLLWHQRWVGSGAAFGCALIFVKILPLIFIPAMWPQSGKRTRWLFGCAVLPGLIYGVCLCKGLDVLQPLRFEGKEITSGCLPFLLAPLRPTGVSMIVFDGVLLFALATVVGPLALRHSATRPQRCVFLLALTLLVLLIFSKKAFTNYLVMVWFPICVCAVASSRGRGLTAAGMLGGFGTLALLEPSLWFRWFGRRDLTSIFSDAFRSEILDGSDVRLTVFLICEVMLIGFYVWYGFLSWKLCRVNQDDNELVWRVKIGRTKSKTYHVER